MLPSAESAAANLSKMLKKTSPQPPKLPEHPQQQHPVPQQKFKKYARPSKPVEQPLPSSYENIQVKVEKLDESKTSLHNTTPTTIAPVVVYNHQPQLQDTIGVKKYVSDLEHHLKKLDEKRHHNLLERQGRIEDMKALENDIATLKASLEVAEMEKIKRVDYINDLTDRMHEQVRVCDHIANVIAENIQLLESDGTSDSHSIINQHARLNLRIDNIIEEDKEEAARRHREHQYQLPQAAPLPAVLQHQQQQHTEFNANWINMLSTIFLSSGNASIAPLPSTQNHTNVAEKIHVVGSGTGGVKRIVAEPSTCIKYNKGICGSRNEVHHCELAHDCLLCGKEGHKFVECSRKHLICPGYNLFGNCDYGHTKCSFLHICIMCHGKHSMVKECFDFKNLSLSDPRESEYCMSWNAKGRCIKENCCKYKAETSGTYRHLPD